METQIISLQTTLEAMENKNFQDLEFMTNNIKLDHEQLRLEILNDADCILGQIIKKLVETENESLLKIFFQNSDLQHLIACFCLKYDPTWNFKNMVLNNYTLNGKFMIEELYHGPRSCM